VRSDRVVTVIRGITLGDMGVLMPEVH